jgi:hypothetical protein
MSKFEHRFFGLCFVAIPAVLLSSWANAAESAPSKPARCHVEEISRPNPTTGKRETVQALVCPKTPRVFVIGE